jgi:hypothetical protein
MKASKRMKKLSRKIHKLADKLADKLHLGDGARNRMHKTICTVTDHPVDVANGRISTEQTDFEIAGPLPLVWERTWYSTSTYRGPLGHGWHHAYDVALHVTDMVLLLRAADGRHLPLPPLADGEEFFDRKEKLTLRRIGGEYRVTGKDGLTHVFAKSGQTCHLARRPRACAAIAGLRCRFPARSHSPPLRRCPAPTSRPLLAASRTVARGRR